MGEVASRRTLPRISYKSAALKRRFSVKEVWRVEKEKKEEVLEETGLQRVPLCFAILHSSPGKYQTINVN